MNTKTLLAAVALTLAGTAALAESPTIVADTFVAQKTRAEVQAETLQALAAGRTLVSEVDLSTTRPAAVASTLTREQVRAEVRNTPRVRAMQFNPAA